MLGCADIPKRVNCMRWEIGGERRKLKVHRNMCINAHISVHRLRPLKNVQFCSRLRKTKILTTDIHWVFRGLKFESDEEIGQKGAFCKSLRVFIPMSPKQQCKIYLHWLRFSSCNYPIAGKIKYDTSFIVEWNGYILNDLFLIFTVRFWYLLI